MKLNRFLSLFLVMLASSAAMMAQQISASQAMARARAFMQNGGGPRHIKGAAVPQLKLAYTQTRKPDGKVCYYVFNYTDGTGFIIMGGDEAAREVLAYSDAGSFDYDKAPDGFKWWLSQYEDQISYVIDNSAKMTPRKAASTASRADIAPLVQTTWNQGSPYSDAVNAAYQAQGGTSTFVTGCVATAMAQVMNYHECPATTGTGSHSYTCKSNSGFKPSVDFSATTYDWANMLDDYSGSYSADQGNAVATLMYHAGVAVNMDYNTAASGGSGAYVADVEDALKNYFGYDKTIRYEYRSAVTDDKWEEMIYSQLSRKLPVIYGGQSTGGGHCFVCDGYRSSDDTYHFNWGWGGYCDCYCPLTGTNALKPGGSGTGGAGDQAAYSSSQEAIINVQKDNGGLETPCLRNYKSTLTLYDGTEALSAYSHTHGTSKTLQLTGSVWNQSSTLTTFTLGVKATDTTTGLTYYWSDSKPTSLGITSYRDCTVSFDADDLPYNGTYTLQLVGRNTGSTSTSDWYEVESKSSVTLPAVTVTGASDPARTDVTFSISNTEVEASRTVQITYTSSYQGAVGYTSSDESIATVSASGLVTGVAPGTATITAHAGGNLYFNETTQEFTVKVRAFQKSDVDVSISSTGLQIGQTATITVTSGYDGTPQYSTSDAAVATVANGVVTAVSAGNATITVTIPETSNYNGTSATFSINVTASDVYLTEAPYFSNGNNPWAGDTFLHYCIKSTTEGNVVVYFLMKFYKITDSGETYMGGTGFTLSGESPFTYESTRDISSTQLEEGATYRIDFLSDANWSVPYNIPSITFTYRATANVDLKIGSAGYATLILPFDADIPATGSDGTALDWKFYECSSLTGSTINLKEASTIERNTPYLISGAVQGTHTFTGPEAVDASPVLFGDGMLKGTMLTDAYQFVPGDYILQNHRGTVAFYKYNTDSGEWFASPYRAFLQTDAKAPFTSLNFPSVTGITDTEMPNAAREAGIYSINGVRRTSLQPGLNIVVDESGTARKLFIKK